MSGRPATRLPACLVCLGSRKIDTARGVIDPAEPWTGIGHPTRSAARPGHPISGPAVARTFDRVRGILIEGLIGIDITFVILAARNRKLGGIRDRRIPTPVVSPR
jgi:hypothetical protein